MRSDRSGLNLATQAAAVDPDLARCLGRLDQRFLSHSLPKFRFLALILSNAQLARIGLTDGEDP
jgi:hypothetical protein